MRPLHKRKSLYYGCKVRNLAAICACNKPKFELARIPRQRSCKGEALVSTVLFDNVSEVLHDRVNVMDVRPRTDRDYTVRGFTALLDAIGGAIHHVGNVHKYARPEDVPEHTMFVITTDGMENASRRYNSEKVKQMIERQKAKYGWEFLFLGANIDAVETASQFGIGADRAVKGCGCFAKAQDCQVPLSPTQFNLELSCILHVSTDYLLMGSEPSKEEVKNDLLSIISELSTIAKKI